MTLSSLSHNDYTVAWVCALPLELAAAKSMLDETHRPLPQLPTDRNVYSLGSISSHNVVITCLPFGVYGVTSAATVLANIMATFAQLQFCLMVGIGGGVPSDRADIRLGDVVVSKPTAASSGVIQYDYGKSLSNGRFQRTGSLNKPPQILLAAASQMQSDHMIGKIAIKQIILDILEKNQQMKDQFSPPNEDWLFHATYNHKDSASDCSTCDLNQLVNRIPRVSDEPYIHYGVIASGNQVMKDAQTRDRMAQEAGILCFEMEAAGLMDLLPCLVIRGISDYCDSHKHNRWQGYAALAAAASAKLLLSITPTTSYRKGSLGHRIEMTPQELECLRSLFVTDPAENRNALKRRRGNRAVGTCEWILETDELRGWLGLETAAGYQYNPNILWLYGNPGTGKSTLAITMTEELPNQQYFASGDKTLAYFFCDATSEKQRTVTAILRGLLYQLVKKRPEYMEFILPKYQERKADLFTSFDALWAILMDIGRDTNNGTKLCIIDALDECERESQDILLTQINQTFKECRLKNSPSSIHIMITSRPYPEISRHLGGFYGKDLASYKKIKEDLQIFIREKTKELSQINKYPEKVTKEVSQILEEKSEGTFLWVGIACDELRPIRSRDAVKTLQSLPMGLHSLYQKLLDMALKQDEEDNKTILQILSFVSISLRPLSVVELYEACHLYPDEDMELRLKFTLEDIDTCRLMIIVQDGIVRLLHKSVKDFLLNAQHGALINDLKSHANLANRCISHFLYHSKSEGYLRDKKLKTSFLEYAIRYWPNHIAFARNEFNVKAEHEKFFLVESDERENWLADYIKQRYSDYIPKGFSIFHVAARWGIPRLIQFALTNREDVPEKGTLSATEKEAQFNDAEFEADNGVTPLEQAAIAGQAVAMTTLLDKGASNMVIRRRVLLAAVGNQKNGKDMLTILLDCQGDQIPITKDVVKRAAENWSSGKDIMALLLDRRGDQIPITEDVIEAAAGNERHGKDIMELLLDRRGDQIPITKDVVKRAARNCNSGKDIMALLLDQGDQIAITEDVVKAAAGNGGHAKDIMELLLDRRGDQIPVTKDVVKDAAGNWTIGKDIMALLLDRRGDQIHITEDVVEVVARNGGCGKDIMELLLDRQGDRVPITENVVRAAAENWNSGKRMMALLLDRQGHRIPITEDVVMAAANNQFCGKDVMELLLDRQGDQIPITEDLIKAAANNRLSGKDIMELLLDHRGDQVHITENVVKAAASNWNSGKDIMALLLDQRGGQIPISEDVVEAVARNGGCGKDIMELLLDRQGDQVLITEDVVKAAVGNKQHGKDIMELLLDQQGYQVPITEDVVKAAAENWNSGKDIMAFLLNQQEDQIHSTLGGVLMICQLFDSQIVKLLLDREGDQISITEDLIKAAAKNQLSGKDVMELLLDRRGDQVPITENVVKAAACNWNSGKDIMALLLDQGDQIPITEDVAEAVATGNEGHGKVIMELLLDHRGDQVPITENVVKAAASNLNSGKDI